MEGMKKKVWILAACTVLLLTGCSQQELADRIFPAPALPERTVTILDGQVKTELAVPEGLTVEEVLAQAEIVLDEDSQVTPELHETAGEEIEVGRRMTVKIFFDGEKQELTLYYGRVRDALAMTSRVLTEQDLVDQEMDSYLYDGMEIHVVHQNQITLVHDGKDEKIFSTAKTVKELLEQEEIEVGEDDRITPELTDKLVEGTEIVIQRVTFREEKTTAEIPYKTTTRENSSMKAGTTNTVQKGQNGSREITYRITLVDGEEESREEISSVVVKEPVNAIVEKGTKQEEKKKAGKHVVKKVKLGEECDGTTMWKYYYSDGSTKIVFK